MSKYPRHCPKCNSFFLNVTWLPHIICLSCGHEWNYRKSSVVANKQPLTILMLDKWKSSISEKDTIMDKAKITLKKLEVAGAYCAIIEADGKETQTRYRDTINEVRLDVESALEMRRLRKKFLTRK